MSIAQFLLAPGVKGNFVDICYYSKHIICFLIRAVGCFFMLHVFCFFVLFRMTHGFFVNYPEPSAVQPLTQVCGAARRRRIPLI